MTRKLLFLCGICSPLVYVFMTVIGAEMRPGYSHVYHAVSELLEAGAPNKFILDILLAISNLFSVLFAIGVLQLVRESPHHHQIGIIAAYLLIAAGVLGLTITLFFPMEPRHLTMTFTGLMHLVLVGVLSILGIVTIFLFSIWFKKQADYIRYDTYSFITAIIMIITGVIAATTAITESPLMGLAERITIAVHLQWTFFIALKMYRNSR